MIIQASFFWKNDKPGGLGFTFGPPDFKPVELQDMFTGPIVKEFIRESDKVLGSHIVRDYLSQLEEIGKRKAMGQHIPLALSIMATLNIIWLTDRGFIPQDEFNGYQFVKVL